MLKVWSDEITYQQERDMKQTYMYGMSILNKEQVTIISPVCILWSIEDTNITFRKNVSEIKVLINI